ncbi:MAG: hypothetical protein WBA25_03410 [Jannaschia sp.]
MSKEWIIDVLGDLRGFASANALPTLATQLEEAMVVARTEIAQPSGPAIARANGAQTGRRTATTG